MLQRLLKYNEVENFTTNLIWNEPKIYPGTTVRIALFATSIDEVCVELDLYFLRQLPAKNVKGPFTTAKTT